MKSSRSLFLWSYFLRSLDPPSFARSGIFGGPQSGKTSLLRELIQELRDKRPERRLIIMDPKGQLPGPLCRSLPEIHKSAANNMWARFKTAGMAGSVCSLCWRLGNVTLIIDEAHSVLGRKVPESRLRIFNEGRGKGIGMILATQRPTKLHTDCQNLEILAVGTLLGAADTAVRSGWGVKEILPPHTFEIINLGMKPPRMRIETVPMPRYLG